MKFCCGHYNITRRDRTNEIDLRNRETSSLAPTTTSTRRPSESTTQNMIAIVFPSPKTTTTTTTSSTKTTSEPSTTTSESTKSPLIPTLFECGESYVDRIVHGEEIQVGIPNPFFPIQNFYSCIAWTISLAGRGRHIFERKVQEFLRRNFDYETTRLNRCSLLLKRSS